MSEIPPQNPWQQPPGYSNYPRQNFTDPSGRQPGVYFENIGRAWNIFQANMGTWVLAVLVSVALMLPISIGGSFGINMLVYGTIMPATSFADPRYWFTLVLEFIPNGLAGIFSASMLYMGVKQARGEEVGIADIFSGFSNFGAVFLVTIIESIAIYAGIVCLLVPGIFLCGALAFCQILAIDRKLNAIEAFTTSIRVLKKDAWVMFLLLFVTGLIAALGACLCGVGILFTLPIYYITIGLTYVSFFPGDEAFIAASQPIGVEPPR